MIYFILRILSRAKTVVLTNSSGFNQSHAFQQHRWNLYKDLRHNPRKQHISRVHLPEDNSLSHAHRIVCVLGFLVSEIVF